MHVWGGGYMHACMRRRIHACMFLHILLVSRDGGCMHVWEEDTCMYVWGGEYMHIPLWTSQLYLWTPATHVTSSHTCHIITHMWTSQLYLWTPYYTLYYISEHPYYTLYYLIVAAVPVNTSNTCTTKCQMRPRQCQKRPRCMPSVKRVLEMSKETQK